MLADEGAGEHASENRVNRTQVTVPERVPDEVRQLLVRIGVNLHAAVPGRKHVLDEFMRGRLVSLLAMGLTLRQAASALGLSHVAIWKELKRNAGLSEEVNAARFQAQIEPLLVILRESKRSWRAATWLINYLSKSLAASEETLDERGLYAKERSRERARYIAETVAVQSREIDEARKRMREKRE
jgi:IS30 family transposase